jgi:hypothetical protein
VALQEQKEPCGRGEPYRPSSVGVVLGKPDVVLRGPGAGHPVVKTAPTSADLFGKGDGYYLDLPGNPLSPGCTFEKALDRWGDGQPSIAYTHLAREAGRPGKLALQYWLYYGFNDFNDKHESDWEMIQIVFPAGDARRALSTSPLETAYSQHAGGERADWNDDKLESKEPILLSIPAPARTRTTTPRRSGSAAELRRASAATTPAGPRSVSQPTQSFYRHP